MPPQPPQVDGPFHFFVNQPRKANGGTALKRRLLADNGWVCVPVTGGDWDCRGDEERCRLILERVRLAGIDPSDLFASTA
jgi:hypothetical protein